MRVLVVTSSLARYPGDPLAAGGNAVYEILRSFGDEVEGTVVTPAQAGAATSSHVGNFVVHRVKPQRPVASLHNAVRGPGAVRVLRVAAGLRRAARRRAPGHDLVHAHWAFPAGWASTGLGIPLVTSFPGSDVHRYPQIPVLGRLVQRVVQASEVAVALDPVGSKVLVEAGARQVAEIPHGIPVESFPVVPPPDNRAVVYVGRLAPEKGVRVLLEALVVAARREPAITLTVVGDGPEATPLRAHAHELGLDNRVTFTGALERERVVDAIANARVLAVPSFHEAFPAVALEALAVGRPVVASAVGALPRLLAAGGGRVVPPGSPTGLAEALLDTLRSDWCPRSLHERARRFDVGLAARSYAALYQQVADVAARADDRRRRGEVAA